MSLAPRSSIVAVLLGGFVVDFLGTLVIGSIVTVAFLVPYGLGGEPSDADVEAATSSALYLSIVSVVGAAATLAGGYTAARWARRRFVAHGVAAGGFSLLLAVPLMASPDAMEPFWLNASLIVAHVPIAALGGRLAAGRAA